MSIEIRRSLPRDVRYAEYINGITESEHNLGILSTHEVGKILTQQRGLLAIETSTENLAGFCLNPRLTKDWVFIRSFEVEEKYRRRGIGYALLERASQEYVESNIIIVTKEPSVARMLTRLGFLPFQRRQPPFLVKLAHFKEVFFNRSFLPQVYRNLKNVGDYQYFARFS